ncbi:hypothetical protein KCU99_g8178, partial [Aureobasidium melanogenum]
MKLIYWLQHHWCLYICWLIQLPAMCCFAFATLIAWTMGRNSHYSAEGKLIFSLCLIMILVYIYQIFFYFIHRLTVLRMLCVQLYQSAFTSFLMYYFRKEFFPLESPPKNWAPIARAVWIGLPVIFATFYVLLARSFVVWFRIRKGKDNSFLGKDGEELESLLHGENYV